jgi:hypothetical protein
MKFRVNPMREHRELPLFAASILTFNTADACASD